MPPASFSLLVAEAAIDGEPICTVSIEIDDGFHLIITVQMRLLFSYSRRSNNRTKAVKKRKPDSSFLQSYCVLVLVDIPHLNNNAAQFPVKSVDGSFLCLLIFILTMAEES